ncbi:MAG: protein translocase subunit SecF, partial [archaeon]|nr:protein translocase subunit SecF [archaeon]
FQLREVGSSLGESFWQNAITITIASMILIIIVVFVFFRELVPSLAIIAAAIFDILCALGLMAWFGVNLSLATIPAVLSLVGYSIGTDILLTTRLLKRKEKTSSERTMDAFKTGITMTITTLVAVIVLLGFAYFYQMLIVFEISIVLLFGLIGDVISTWMMNAPILLMYLEKKKAVQ